MRKILILCILIISSIMLMACGTETADDIKDEANVVLADDVKDALAELNSIQVNYSNGTAPLMEIPIPFVEALYNNWDDIILLAPEDAPILLREYVDPGVVYFDYESGYSVKWNKDENSVSVEETDMEAHEDYKQKAHK